MKKRYWYVSYSWRDGGDSGFGCTIIFTTGKRSSMTDMSEKIRASGDLDAVCIIGFQRITAEQFKHGIF